ncbi:hypothetical protein C8R46DRAFT_1187277 [Mycena filopes]|nr:hypothetical protein C8R46DRAFT_1187277 [Mycena filopes]
MRSHLPVKAFGIILLGLISVLEASHPSHYRSPSNDVHCPADEDIAFVHNSFTFNAPVQKFTNIAKSFFDIGWYGGDPATIVTGTDNVPGATRFGPLNNGSSSFNETLTMYTVDKSGGLSYTLHGLPGVTYALSGYEGVKFGAYAETMRFESICAGRATYIDLITYVCSNDTAGAYQLWYTEHMVTFPALAAGFGATVMAGDCPRIIFGVTATCGAGN